jgi:hypothetical protein
MRANKSSSSEEFERGWRAGQETERALIDQKLHKGFECLTAASFAIELAKKPDDQQIELVSRAITQLSKIPPRFPEKIQWVEPKLVCEMA